MLRPVHRQRAFWQIPWFHARGAEQADSSFFAAQAGAKRVYAVDASDIVSTAASVVESNGMADVLKVVKGTVEDVELPGTLPNTSPLVLRLVGSAALGAAGFCVRKTDS